MAKNAILKIQKAEEKAKDLMDKAHIQAKNIIASAAQKAETELLQLNGRYKEYRAEKREAALESARLESMEFSKETQKLCDELRQQMMPKKPKAVEAVVKIITDEK